MSEYYPTKHEHPMLGQTLINVENFAAESSESATKYQWEGREVVTNLGAANAVTSLNSENLTHKPVLDIDLPVKLIPSSTGGHFHLYIDKEMSWGKYLLLLNALVEVGIVEQGYVDAASRRGYTAVRLPWIEKERRFSPPFSVPSWVNDLQGDAS